MTNETSENVSKFYIGDVDPVAYGGMWIELEDGYYTVVQFEAYGEEESVRVGQCAIAVDEVYDEPSATVCGVDEDADPFMLVYAQVTTWGCEHLGGDYVILDSEEKARQFLQRSGLTWN